MEQIPTNSPETDATGNLKPLENSEALKKIQKEQRKMIIKGIVLILVIIIIGPLLILSIFAAGDLMANNTAGKYLKLTNIGFALFGGVATLMFNWARSLDMKGYPFEIEQINEIGEHSTIGGLGFLIASLFQFLQTLPHDKGLLELMPCWYYSILPHLIRIIFILTSLFAVVIIFEIINIYAEVVHVRKKLKNVGNNSSPEE